VLAQVLQVLQALQALQGLRVLQALPSPLLAQVLQALQALQALQVLQPLPSPLLVSAAVIDCSPSTKKSQETLKLQITPLISSYTLTSFLFDKTLLLNGKSIK